MTESPFELRLVNGLQGDPVIYTAIKRLGEALLFDLGSIDLLSHRDLLRVKHVFVSHTHMDHFIGFERLLRVNVPHKRLIRMWGPAPLIQQVHSKLCGYTWNLIEPDQIRFHVSEIHPNGTIEEALLGNADGFAIKRQVSDQTLGELCQLADGSKMGAVILDHRGTASIGYRLEAPEKFRVRSERLDALGLKPGSWVSLLQLKMRQELWEEELQVQGQVWTVRALGQELIEREVGHALAYLTDLSFDPINLQRLRQSFLPSDHVIAECSFLNVDRQRAVDKAHLTTLHSALLARALGASHLHSFHISGIYGQGPDEVMAEVQRCFAELLLLDAEQLELRLTEELEQVRLAGRS